MLCVCVCAPFLSPACTGRRLGSSSEVMSLLRRPAAAVLRRPAAAVLCRPAAAHAVCATLPTFDLVGWEAQLDLGPVDDELLSSVYLVTLPRVLAATLASTQHLQDPSSLSREQIRDAVWGAMENLDVTARGGRPRDPNQGPLMLKVSVVKEKHSDGSYHFHVGLKLRSQQRFLAARRTLLDRHGLASHWSSSHTQWWSVVRYLVYTSTGKKLEVDIS